MTGPTLSLPPTARTPHARTAALAHTFLDMAREGFRFALVGTMGFVTHALVLVLCLRGFGLRPYPAWFPAFAVAVTVTYLLNRRWTFRHRAGADRRREFARYVVLMLLGAALNNAVYGLALSLHPLFRDLPLLALAAGSLAGMTANYLTARQLAFTGGR